jgi:hypothetical protein
MLLSGLRLVVTMPPIEFFGGLDRRRAKDHAAALRTLGASVYEFETAAVYRNDRPALQRQIEDIRTFSPDGVVGTQHGGYAIQGGMMYEPDSSARESPKNLFLDVLGLPTIVYWDHVLTQAPRYVIPSWPSLPEESEPGVMSGLNALLAHPNAMHFFPDSEHIAELDRLGIGSFDYDPFFVTAVSQLFVQHGLQQHGSPIRCEELSFFGNIYLSASEQIPYRHREALAKLSDAALSRCAADWNLSPYNAYLGAISEISDESRSMLKLDPDQSFYWRFLYDELSIVANGEHRFRILAACDRPIAFYGGFADPESRAAIASRNWLLRDSLPHDQTLAEAYRMTDLTLDVVNAPFISGFSPKLLECFSAGGFMLTTRKDNMFTVFGDLADTISYSNAAELGAKIDYFLAHESERRSVTREMQEIIRRDHTATALFARTLPGALDRLRAKSK